MEGLNQPPFLEGKGGWQHMTQSSEYCQRGGAVGKEHDGERNGWGPGQVCETNPGPLTPGTCGVAPGVGEGGSH
jgi:hypothetical protein